MAHPIDTYAEAVLAHRAKNRDQAALHLAQSLGSPIVTTPISTSLEVLMKRDSLAHDMVLNLLRVESQKWSKK